MNSRRPKEIFRKEKLLVKYFVLFHILHSVEKLRKLNVPFRLLEKLFLIELREHIRLNYSHLFHKLV